MDLKECRSCGVLACVSVCVVGVCLRLDRPPYLKTPLQGFFQEIRQGGGVNVPMKNMCGGGKSKTL